MVIHRRGRHASPVLELKNMRLHAITLVSLVLAAFLSRAAGQEQKPPVEDDVYRMTTFPLPEDVALEVGGLDWLDKERTRLLACTRRGELWVIDNVYADQPALAGQKLKIKNEQGKTVEVDPRPEQLLSFKRMLFGLHEPLGMVVNPGHGFPPGIYMAQRSELTRVADEDGDDLIDLVETFCNGWEISGSYHEYAFGPKLGKDGRLWVTLNRPFGGGQEGKALWRGWAVTVDPKGNMKPVCPGLRSPAGLGTSTDGEMFFTDNQGDHVAAGKMAHLKPGVFHGNPVGLDSIEHPLSNFKLPFENYPKKNLKWGEAVAANPKLLAPTVWFPYPQMGRSQTDILRDDSGGKFGPFAGQTFVGDLSNALVMRVFLEKIDGEYQGACFPFRKDFTPPVLRMAWGKGGTMFVGGSSRGWGGGKRPYGLARLTWTGVVPFEIHEMRARPDGFELTFTQPVDPKTAGDPKSYSMNTWTHFFYSNYGDKRQDEHPVQVVSAKVGKDAKSVVLTLDKMQPYYIHALSAKGVRSAAGLPLLHPDAYYTLNRIPKQ
ncbi:MAG: hypothetical protein N2C14_13730 [Planctomycetales bacterium]